MLCADVTQVSAGQGPMELDAGEECVELPLPAVCAYYCALSGRPGKFDPRKAMELGVAKGPVSATPVVENGPVGRRGTSGWTLCVAMRA